MLRCRWTPLRLKRILLISFLLFVVYTLWGGHKLSYQYDDAGISQPHLSTANLIEVTYEKSTNVKTSQDGEFDTTWIKNLTLDKRAMGELVAEEQPLLQSCFVQHLLSLYDYLTDHLNQF